MNGEVEHWKVQVEIAWNDCSRGMAALSELDKIRVDDQGARNLMHIMAGNTELLLDLNPQRFRALIHVLLSETIGKSVPAIRETLLKADNYLNAVSGPVV